MLFGYGAIAFLNPQQYIRSREITCSYYHMPRVLFDLKYINVFRLFDPWNIGLFALCMQLSLPSKIMAKMRLFANVGNTWHASIF